MRADWDDLWGDYRFKHLRRALIEVCPIWESLYTVIAADGNPAARARILPVRLIVSLGDMAGQAVRIHAQCEKPADSRVLVIGSG